MSTTLLPPARGYEISKILNGPYISLLMFVIVAFLFAMTVWNCIYFNKVRNHTVSDTQTAKRPISKREATTLLVVNVIMSLLLAFIAAFFLWKVFLEESVRAHFIKVGDTVGVYSGRVAETIKNKFKGKPLAYDQPPSIVELPSGATAADLSSLFEADPSVLYKTQTEGFYTTEDKMKRFRCFSAVGEAPAETSGGVGLPARFRAAAAPSAPPPPSIQPPRSSLPQVSRVLDTRVNIDLQPLSTL